MTQVVAPAGTVAPSVAGAPFEQWIPLARQVVHTSLRLAWDDVFNIYTYTHTIPIAEAMALEARRAGADTHLTLMTDDLWFTSMQDLPLRWLRTPTPAEMALNNVITAHIYLGGPADARRMRTIPPERFAANARGGYLTDEPARRRKVRSINLPIGRVTPERAEAYNLDYSRWRRSYEAALAVDLKHIAAAGRARQARLSGRKNLRIRSARGTDLRCRLAARAPVLDDGILSGADMERGYVEATLPAGTVGAVVDPRSADGTVYFDLPLFAMGRPVEGFQCRFRGGRLVEWQASSQQEVVAALFKGVRRELLRLSWLTVGLNPAVEPVMLENNIVQDVVSLGLGANRELGGTLSGDFRYLVPAGKVSVEITS